MWVHYSNVKQDGFISFENKEEFVKTLKENSHLMLDTLATYVSLRELNSFRTTNPYSDYEGIKEFYNERPKYHRWLKNKEKKHHMIIEHFKNCFKYHDFWLAKSNTSKYGFVIHP